MSSYFLFSPQPNILDPEQLQCAHPNDTPREHLNIEYQVFTRHMIYTPGSGNPGSLGQFPSPAGSPPMRTNTPTDGVGPFRINIINQPGGLVFASGGAVTVQAFPLHEKAGKIVLWPIALP